MTQHQPTHHPRHERGASGGARLDSGPVPTAGSGTPATDATRPVDSGVPANVRGGRVHVPRTRGALSGLLLVVLGVWGALIPFVGPAFDFGYTPREVWTWTEARGWLEVLPGVVCVVGGLLLLASRNRVTASFGGWLAVAAGAWFAIGPSLAQPWGLGDLGQPGGSSDWMRALEHISFFTGLGVVIVFLGAIAIGRLSVRSMRDIRAADVRRRDAGVRDE